ncbi:MAG: putative membrane protein [Polaribacter sp.]|jgi:putative membrane protein|tara:strand:+ start:25 stop:564 length:540 start_codon:yes stop_codon:yes gene_type:complete
MNNLAQENKYKKIITALSIIIPIAVAALFGVNLRSLGFDVAPLKMLPPIYAFTNGVTAVLLVGAVIAIKKGNKKLHEQLNTAAIACSLLFLLLYIAYHMTSDSTTFGGEGIIKYVYYFILITHIILSVIVIPFVLITYMKAKLGKFSEHKKIARKTFPLWLYVAVTGVIVYLMISPYYV